MNDSQLHRDVASLREIADRLSRSASELSAQDFKELGNTAVLLQQLSIGGQAVSQNGMGNFFRPLLDSISDGLLTIDRDWRIIFVNQRAAQNSMFQSEDLIGKNLWNTFPQLLGTPLEKHTHQAMQDRTAHHFEYHFEMKGAAQDQWYLVSVYPSSEGITVFWMNHTSTKKAELEQEQVLAENRRQKALLDAIFEADPGAIAVVTGPELCIVQVNPAYRFLTPDPFQDPVGQPYAKIWPPESGEWFSDQIHNALETGQPFLASGIQLHLSIGITRTFTFQARRIDWQDEPAVLVILWDTTEQEKTNQALRESERRLIGVLESMPDAFVSFDADMHYTYVNANAERLLAARREALLGKDVRIVYPDEESNKTISLYEQVLQEQQPMTLTSYHAGFDRWVEVRAFPTPDGVSVFYKDISAQVKAEEARCESEERFHLVLKNMPVVAATLDRDLRYTWVYNPMMGFTASNILGKEVGLSTDPQETEKLQQVLENVISTGQPAHWEVVAAAGAGKRIFETYAEPLYGQNDEISGAALLSVDITDRKQLETQLIEAHRQAEFLARFPEENPNPVARVSMNQKIVLYANSPAANLPGWELIIGQPLPELFLPLLDLAVARGSEVVEDVPFDNGSFYAISVVPCCDENYANFYGRDVTNRRQAEVLLDRYRMLFEHTRDIALFVRLSDGQILEANRAAESAYGYSREELLQLSITGLRAEQTRDQIGAQMAQANTSGVLFATIHRRKDGSTFPVEVSSLGANFEGEKINLSIIRDITERKRAEELAIQYQNRLEAALNSMADAVFISDLQGNFIHFNDAFATYHRFKDKEECAKTFAEYSDILNVFFPDGALAPTEMWAVPRALRGETVTNAEYALQRKDTGERWTGSYNFAPIRDGDGAIVGSVVVGRDITESKQAEQKLLVEKEWLRTTLSSIGDGVITTDPQGRVTFLNPVAEQLTGWNNIEAAGLPLTQVFMILNEQTQEPVKNPVAKVLQEGHIVGLANHTALVTRHGQQIPIEDSAAPIVDQSGQIQGIVMVFHDVSEKRKAEAVVQESQALLNAILEETPDPVFLKDRDSRIMLANRATLELIGKPREEVLGKNDLEHFEDLEIGQAIIENDRKVMESGQTQAIEERVSVAGKEHVYLSVKTPYRDTAGNVIGVIGLAHDITERKAREEEVQKLNRTLLAHTRSSQAMLYARDEASYLQEVCQIITEDCGHVMVWIGLAEEDEAKTVRPVSYAGFEAGYLETLGITWADTERGRGPTGTAIRTGKPVICRNMLTDPLFEPWRAEALKRGYASSLVLPLHSISSGKAFGAITIYSRQPDAFTAEETKLLADLASDLSYGISDLRLRAARAQAEEALALSERRYRSLFEGMTEGFALHDIICDAAGQPVDYRFLEVNPAFEQLTGLSKEKVLGRTVLEVLPGTERYWIEIYGQVALTGEPAQFRNYSGELGKYFEVIAFSPQHGQFAVLFIDVTERVRAEAENRRLAVDLEIKRRLIEQREQERVQIARDLHDGPIQELIAATYLLHGLLMEPLAPEILKEIEEVKTTIHKQVTELRAYAMELRPPILAKMGLESTIRSHLETYQERHPELEIHFEAHQENDEILPEDIRVTLFHIYQESLNNAARHSRATQIEVKFLKTERQAILEIRDNGVGFEMPGEWLTLARQGHLGLVGMQERIQFVEGRLELVSAPGQGLLVRAIIPLARN
ncbi:MAG TPA: PAS domain S-box protein [Anaerolineaceae bacterium]|nr:PAS domain S-box protein [Anaerolineaceae bacterium]